MDWFDWIKKFLRAYCAVEISDEFEVTEFYTEPQASNIHRYAWWNDVKDWPYGLPIGQDAYKNEFFFAFGNTVVAVSGAEPEEPREVCSLEDLKAAIEKTVAEG